MDRRTKLALDLYDCGAFLVKTHPTAIERGNERGFELKLHEKRPEEPLSPFYLTLRTPENPEKPGPLTPELVGDCAREMISLVDGAGFLDEVHYGCICGLPNAGEPFALAMLHINRSRGQEATLLRLKKEKTEQGRQLAGEPEGTFSPGMTVLPIDDLITEAGTKFEAKILLEKAGLVVRDFVVLVNRQQGGKQQLEQAGCRLNAVYTISEFLDIFVKHHRISPELRQEIREYAKLP